MCKTLSNNKVDLLTITDGSQGTKQGIVLTARTHPGETNGSWVMKGMLDFLTDPDDQDAVALRRNFVFKVVPMINVDGVIYGNYRCSLAGIDLNRVWKKPEKIMFPEVAAMKKLMDEFHSEHPVLLYTDLHGHSRTRSSFIYGNNYPKNPESTRLFPYILSKIEPDIFSFTKCKFKVEKEKTGTSRV